MFWIILIEAIALVFSFFAMINTNSSWQITRGKDLPIVAKVVFTLAAPAIVGGGLLMKSAWWYFVIFIVAIGVVSIMNQEGQERHTAWKCFLFPLVIGAFYTYAGWIDKIESTSPIRLPLIIILAATIFTMIAGLVKSAILAGEEDSFSGWFKHNWKTMLLVVILIFVGCATITLGLWAFS